MRIGEQQEDSEKRKLSCWEITLCFSFPFLVDDPTRAETETRCQSLQEVARELTLLPYWVYSSLPFSLLSPIRYLLEVN